MSRPATLAPDETELVGQWLASERKIAADLTCVRIEWLVSECLIPLATAESGWDQLYRDPGSGKLWELTWPHSEMHGGGPPRLAQIAPETARLKYGGLADG